MVASLVTDTARPARARRCRALAPLVAAGELAGIHLEGPVAQRRSTAVRTTRRCCARPTPPRWTRLLDAGDGTVRMVTLAPELDRRARRGAPCSPAAASSPRSATPTRPYDVARAALDAGATVGTHLFNAMRAAAPPRARARCSRCSSDPRVVRRADRRRRPPASRRCCAGPRRRPQAASSWSPTRWPPPVLRTATTCSGPAAVQVRDGVARLASNGAIAGSTLTMDRAVRYAVTDRRAAASRPSSRRPPRRPARVLGPHRRRCARGGSPGRPGAPRRATSRSSAGDAGRRLAGLISRSRARGARGAGSAPR